MHKVLGNCPVCGGATEVTALTCTVCGVGVTGHFQTCDFCRLTDEQATFLRLFVQRFGKLSEMEKALGISYPTVRNKLEEIIRVLHPEEQPSHPDPSGERDAVLQRVASGALSAREALELLSGARVEVQVNER